MTPQEWTALHWDRCRPWLEEALTKHPLRTHSIENVKEALDRGDCQLWPTENSAAVVEVVKYPTGIKTVHFWLCGGKLCELKRTAQSVEAYAKEIGAAAVTLTAIRPGWDRFFRRYKPVARQLVLELT